MPLGPCRAGTDVFIILLYLLSLLLFVAPGLLAARTIRLGGRRSDPMLLALAASFGGLLGYVAFWIYFASPRAGFYFSSIYIALSLLSWIWLLISRAGRKVIGMPDVSLPLLFWLGVGVFYLGGLYSVQIGFPADVQARHRYWPVEWGQDDTAPQRLAELLYRGENPRVPDSEWGMSDRPPLQAGMFLVQRPLSLWTGLGIGGHYEAVAVGFQCCWVPAVWVLARLSGLTPQQALRTLTLLAFSGFVLFNSVFVWPKMLAGAFGLLAASPLVSESRPLSACNYAVAGAAAGLAWLAHGGVAFTLLALAAVFLIPRYLPGWRSAVAALGVFLALALPWYAYQKWYDPPGDKLAKAHFAGQLTVEQSPDESVARVLLQAYQRLTVVQILEYKVANAQTLVGPVPPLTLDGWRLAEFNNFAYALGPLWLGLPLLVLPSRRRLWPWLAVGMLSVLLCVLLLYGPGAAHIRHGSYAGYLAIFGAAAAALALLPERAYALVLAIQAIWCIVVWLVSPALAAQGQPEPAMIIVAAVAMAILLLLLARDGGSQ